MNLLIRVVRLIDGLNEWVGRLVAWLTTFLVLVVCFDVVTRYLLNESMVAVQELEWHVFALIFLLGAAYTLKEDGHVRVDVFYSHMAPKKKALIDLIGCLFLLIPFAILVVGTSKAFVQMSWAVHEGSPNPGGLPARYLLKAAIPAGFVLVLLQGISLAVRSFLVLVGRPVDGSDTAPADGKEAGHA